MRLNPALKSALGAHRQADVWEDLVLADQAYLARRKPHVFFGDEVARTNTARSILAHSRLINQCTIHRNERLFLTVAALMSSQDYYSPRILVRAHLEGTARLGYLLGYFERYRAGTFDQNKMFDLLERLGFGLRAKFAEWNPDPINVLSMIDGADKEIKRRFYPDDKSELSRLRQSYEWMSESAHPNSVSNLIAMKLDAENHRMLIEYDRDFDFRESDLLNHLMISHACGIVFYDLVEELIDEMDK